MVVPPTTDAVRVGRDGTVITIALDRPANQKGLTRDVLAALQGIVDRVTGDEEGQAVVITGPRGRVILDGRPEPREELLSPGVCQNTGPNRWMTGGGPPVPKRLTFDLPHGDSGH